MWFSTNNLESFISHYEEHISKIEFDKYGNPICKNKFLSKKVWNHLKKDDSNLKFIAEYLISLYKKHGEDFIKYIDKKITINKDLIKNLEDLLTTSGFFLIKKALINNFKNF